MSLPSQYFAVTREAGVLTSADTATFGCAAQWIFKTLTYNVFLRSLNIFPDGQMERAAHIATMLQNDQKFADTDLFVFNELFDTACYDIISKAMKANGVGFRTKILGAQALNSNLRVHSLLSKHRFVWCSGGVVIFSRHPIIASTSHIFDGREITANSDALALKGFVYVKVEVNVKSQYPKTVHVLATHLQSGSDDQAANCRINQAKRIQSYVHQLNIPVTEAVIIAGDLNVDGQSIQNEAWATLAQALNVAPVANYHEITVDPMSNTLFGRDGDLQVPPCRLDHCLYSKAHLKPYPLLSFTEVIRPVIPHGASIAIGNNNMFRRDMREITTTDLSDHYPVLAHFSFPLA
jgi:endonuclease/exonuclease/phosphatase family metal-dependent hydrolase